MGLEIGNLPDKVSEMEAYWHVIMLAHGMCMIRAYRELLNDEKAAYNIVKACEFIERSVKRAYPTREADILLKIAKEKADIGFQRQSAIERQLIEKEALDEKCD